MNWYLETFLGSSQITRVPLRLFPFRIGRCEPSELVLDIPKISRLHAELHETQGHLYIQDCGSTNGTFVNRQKIDAQVQLRHGDVVHIAETEIRIIDATQVRGKNSSPSGVSDKTMFTKVAPELKSNLPYGIRELEELIDKRLLEPVFQEIMTADNNLYGFECLSRGKHDALPASPGALFNIAESIGFEIELSELMRDLAVESVHTQHLEGRVYVNTHPKELIDCDRLLASLALTRSKYPDLKIMLEIHEKAITDAGFIRVLKDSLIKLDIELAFDDFGVGQSRLLELIEAVPDVVKFDLALIESVHQAPVHRVSLIKKLLELTNEMHITTLAECVSNHEEYQACVDLGFDLFQGYYFSRPRAIIDTS